MCARVFAFVPGPRRRRDAQQVIVGQRNELMGGVLMGRGVVLVGMMHLVARI